MSAVLALGTRSHRFTDVEPTAFLKCEGRRDPKYRKLLYYLGCHRLYSQGLLVP